MPAVKHGQQGVLHSAHRRSQIDMHLLQIGMDMFFDQVPDDIKHLHRLFAAVQQTGIIDNKGKLPVGIQLRRLQQLHIPLPGNRSHTGLKKRCPPMYIHPGKKPNMIPSTSSVGWDKVIRSHPPA